MQIAPWRKHGLYSSKKAHLIDAQQVGLMKTRWIGGTCFQLRRDSLSNKMTEETQAAPLRIWTLLPATMSAQSAQCNAEVNTRPIQCLTSLATSGNGQALGRSASSLCLDRCQTVPRPSQKRAHAQSHPGAGRCGAERRSVWDKAPGA